MAQPTFIAIADVHLGAKLYNIPELAEDLKEDFKRAVDLAIAKKVKYLVIAGDLFDSNKPTPDLVDFVAEQVEKAGSNGCIVTGIAGDHDKPINSSSWIHLSGVVPIMDLNEPSFLGFDYCDTSMDNIQKIIDYPNKQHVEWIFLHGQVPELFSFVEEKKKLDFKEVDLINTCPKLKGVILGDIHTTSESVIHDPKMVRTTLPYIGYCGSLGMVKPKEVGHKKGLLYYDGEKLSRLKFEMTRKCIKLNLADSIEPINWISKYTNFFKDNKGKKPLFIVEYDSSSEHLLAKASPLFEVGLVRTAHVKFKGAAAQGEDEGETINIRSELNTEGRIDKVLKQVLTNKTAYDLAAALLSNDDATAILDKFKQDTLEENEQ